MGVPRPAVGGAIGANPAPGACAGAGTGAGAGADAGAGAAAPAGTGVAAWKYEGASRCLHARYSCPAASASLRVGRCCAGSVSAAPRLAGSSLRSTALVRQYESSAPLLSPFAALCKGAISSVARGGGRGGGHGLGLDPVGVHRVIKGLSSTWRVNFESYEQYAAIVRGGGRVAYLEQRGVVPLGPVLRRGRNRR